MDAMDLLYAQTVRYILVVDIFFPSFLLFLCHKRILRINVSTFLDYLSIYIVVQSNSVLNVWLLTHFDFQKGHDDEANLQNSRRLITYFQA